MKEINLERFKAKNTYRVETKESADLILDNSIEQKMQNSSDTVDFAESKEDNANMQPIYTNIKTRPRGNSGLLEYRFTYNKRQMSAYGYSNKECWEDAERKKATASDNKRKKPNASQYNFELIINEWYNRYRKSKQAPKAQAETQRYISEICAAFGSKDIRKIRSDELQDFANSMNATGRKRDVVMGLVKAVFRKYTPRLVKYNPCDELEIAKHRSKPRPLIQLSDQRRIFESATNARSNVFCKFFMVSCCLGARLTELYNALPTIDFKNGIAEIVDEDTETKNHRRYIPFLRDLFTEKDRDEFLKYRISGIQSHFKRLFRKLGIDACVQSFRVTFISCCNHVGINQKQIQEWAGHKKLDTTMNTYAKLLKRDGTSPILEYIKRLKEFIESEKPY